MNRLLIWMVLTLALSACGGSPPSALPARVADNAADVIEEVQGALADQGDATQQLVDAAITAPVLAMQAAVAEALPAPESIIDRVIKDLPAAPAHRVSPDAVALIVGFEIISPAYYVKRLQSPIYPGGASGATIGIGYDLGHQTRATIAADWADHPQIDRLLPAAGVRGADARVLVRTMRDVRVPLDHAQRVFQASTLPTYNALTARAYATGWDALPPNASGSLTATVYNRGASMRGDRRREMREMRDTCVPAADTACMAAQYRSMKRLWVGTSIEVGLSRRYEATAQLAERGA